MTKTYTITVRDLSNEAKVIKAREEEIKYFREAVTKEIEVLGASHSTAIISYFNHQLDEIEKITDDFDFRYGTLGVNIRVVLRRGNRALYTTSLNHAVYKGFDLKDKDLVIPSEYLEVLMLHWERIKHGIKEAIQFKLEAIEKNNIRIEDDLATKISLFRNFEL